MAYKPRQASKSNSAVPPVMSPDAAGIDIGATEIFVTVSADRAGKRSVPSRRSRRICTRWRHFDESPKNEAAEKIVPTADEAPDVSA